MKLKYLVVFCLFLAGCQNDPEPEDVSSLNDGSDLSAQGMDQLEKTRETLLVRRWRFNERKSADGETTVKYGDQSSDVVMRLERNGFYMVYDSITDQRIIDKGVRTLEQRHSGQWNLIDENTLVLQRIGSDTIIFDTLLIDLLDDNELVTTTKNKNKITYFSID
jgi:hypothetical protein